MDLRIKPEGKICNNDITLLKLLTTMLCIYKYHYYLAGEASQWYEFCSGDTVLTYKCIYIYIIFEDCTVRKSKASSSRNSISSSEDINPSLLRVDEGSTPHQLAERGVDGKTWSFINFNFTEFCLWHRVHQHRLPLLLTLFSLLCSRQFTRVSIIL